MSVHAVGVAGLLLVFVIGTLRPINLGALALVMTWLVGQLFVGESVADMYSGFPVNLLILLAGVTYLFAVAANNGTVRCIIDGFAGLVRDRRTLVPWIVFVLAALPAMAGALGSTGVALLAPLSLRLARRYDIDRRMIGLMVVHGAASGNFSPLNVLGAMVTQSVAEKGLEMAPSALFLANLAYNALLAAIIWLAFGGRRLSHARDPLAAVELDEPRQQLGAEQICTLVALISVAIAALVFGLSIGFLAFAAAVLLQLVFPASARGAEQKIAWGVVLLICGIVTYVNALQRYGTVQALGDSLAALNAPLLTALLICAVAGITSAFASSAGILGAMIPLAAPFMATGEIGTTGLVVALSLSATVVDATPFSTVGALVVASAEPDERPRIFRGLLLWGIAMILTAPLITWLIFVVPA